MMTSGIEFFFQFESAILGGANFLATEDPDLYDDPRIVQALRVFGIRVIRAGEFVEILKTK